MKANDGDGLKKHTLLHVRSKSKRPYNFVLVISESLLSKHGNSKSKKEQSCILSRALDIDVAYEKNTIVFNVRMRFSICVRILPGPISNFCSNQLGAGGSTVSQI